MLPACASVGKAGPVVHPSSRRCVALIGEEGSGVTTLTRALTRYEPNVVWLDAGANSELTAGACLTACDAVIIVVSAVQGLSADIELLWERVGHLPTTVVVTHLDAPRADIDESAAVCKRVLGLDLQIPYLPIHDDDGSLAGFLDVLGDVIHVWEGDNLQVLPTDDEHRALTQAYRDDLIDLLLAEAADDATIESMATGSHVSQSQVTAWLQDAIAAARIHVALGFAAVTPRGDIGLNLIAAIINDTTPAIDAHLPPVMTSPQGDPAEPLLLDGPAVALVLGRDESGTCCRVLAGTIAQGDRLAVVTSTGHTPWTASWSDSMTAHVGDVVHTTFELAAGTTITSPDSIVMVESG